MEKNSRTKNIVLARAHAVYFFRPLFTRPSAALLTLAVALYLIGQKVWVARVFENMPNPVHVLAVARFFEAAFLNTHFIVQVLTVIAFGAAIWLARECARVLAGSLRYA